MNRDSSEIRTKQRFLVWYIWYNFTDVLVIISKEAYEEVYTGKKSPEGGSIILVFGYLTRLRKTWLKQFGCVLTNRVPYIAAPTLCKNKRVTDLMLFQDGCVKLAFHSRRLQIHKRDTRIYCKIFRKNCYMELCIWTSWC